MNNSILTREEKIISLFDRMQKAMRDGYELSGGANSLKVCDQNGDGYRVALWDDASDEEVFAAFDEVLNKVGK